MIIKPPAKIGVKGRLALMVAIVLSGILFASFIVPSRALMFIGEYVPVDAVSLFLKTAELVFIPTIAAKLTQLSSKESSEKMLNNAGLFCFIRNCKPCC